MHVVIVMGLSKKQNLSILEIVVSFLNAFILGTYYIYAEYDVEMCVISNRRHNQEFVCVLFSFFFFFFVFVSFL